MKYITYQANKRTFWYIFYQYHACVVALRVGNTLLQTWQTDFFLFSTFPPVAFSA